MGKQSKQNDQTCRVEIPEMKEQAAGDHLELEVDLLFDKQQTGYLQTVSTFLAQIRISCSQTI
jgi:hypothetical protein